MSRDKQIEEMVIALTESQHEFDKAWKECLHNNAKMPDRENVFYAKYLIEQKGYRKASEVAEEIFEEIHKIIVHRILYNENYHFEGVIDSITKDLDELKKKYTKGNNDAK